jgi:hypothetical protein
VERRPVLSDRLRERGIWVWVEVGGRRHLMLHSPRDGLARRATGGQHSEPMELTPDWCGSTKEWAQDITFIDDPVGLAVLWHSCRCSVMLSSHRGDAGGRRPTRGWCERRVLVQGIVALGESSSHSGPQREGEPRGVACAGFRDRLRERGFGRGERWRLCCPALLFGCPPASASSGRGSGELGLSQ